MSINRKASKKTGEIANVENLERINFKRYLEYYGDRRLTQRLLKGRTIKPCGKECWEYGEMIARSFNHGSFVNFKDLMDDKDFLIYIAGITPNPTECANYFYIYVNQYLKKDEEFKYELLKAIYANENVFKLEDINVIVEFCHFEKENEKIKNDESVRLMLEDRLYQLDYGPSKKHIDDDYVFGGSKHIENCEKTRDSVRLGLRELISTFAGAEKEETIDDIRDSIDIKFF